MRIVNPAASRGLLEFSRVGQGVYERLFHRRRCFCAPFVIPAKAGIQFDIIIDSASSAE